MTRTVKILLPIAVLAAGIAIAVGVVKARPSVDRQPATALPPLVRIIEVEPRDMNLVVRSQGTVRPVIESTLVAQVADGRIDSNKQRSRLCCHHHGPRESTGTY